MYHNFPNGDFINNLRDGLRKFERLHRLNPNHEVVTIWLELKNAWRTDGHSPADLDRCIDQELATLVYRPSNVIASTPNALDLREAVSRGGWPALENIRGRFLFVLMGNDEAGRQYLSVASRESLCFAAPEDDLYAKLHAAPGDIWRNAIFFNCHNTDGLDVPRAVHAAGLVARIWRVDDQEEYEFALRSMAHHVATDHVTQELFVPLLVDAQGNPFRPF